MSETKYVDQTNCPCDRKLYLYAARAKCFPSGTKFRKTVALRSDVVAWLERVRLGEQAAQAPKSNVESLMKRLNLKRKEVA